MTRSAAPPAKWRSTRGGRHADWCCWRRWCFASSGVSHPATAVLRDEFCTPTVRNRLRRSGRARTTRRPCTRRRGSCGTIAIEHRAPRLPPPRDQWSPLGDAGQRGIRAALGGRRARISCRAPRGTRSWPSERLWRSTRARSRCRTTTGPGRSGRSSANLRTREERRRRDRRRSPSSGLGAGTGSGLRTGAWQRFTYYEADPGAEAPHGGHRQVLHLHQPTPASAGANDRTSASATVATKLKEDKDRKYTLILVDQAERLPGRAGRVLSRKPVQLYFDRPDGGRHCRATHLEQVPRPRTDVRPARGGPEAGSPRSGATAPNVLPTGQRPRRAGWCLRRMKRHLVRSRCRSESSIEQFGTKFLPLDDIPGVPVWTDAHSEVLALVFSPVVQRIRSHFGLPDPIPGSTVAGTAARVVCHLPISSVRR